MSDQMIGVRVAFSELFEPRDATEGLRPRIREIEIPVIQRDYAQGRELEQVRSIRISFLEALRDALTGGSPLSLDFVWGDLTNEVLRPLDGQQRLTTLFLLHWYLAQRANVDIEGQGWTRFSYATRPSSRRFVQELCRANLPDELPETCGTWIADQEWFHYGWEHDPTVKSMLVMLDAIEETFRDDDVPRLWARLVETDSPPVSFYILPIPEMGQGDTLYIKMNSRGKPLTPFENFKALFEQVVANSPHGDEIAHKIDGVWSDVMWPYRGDDDIVDDEFMNYFTFLIEMGEWRAKLEPEGRLIDRAERLFGGDCLDSPPALDFFVDALDTWVDENPETYFQSMFRSSGDEPDDRPTLFTPEHLKGVNLFAQACAHYGDMRTARARSFPLGLALLLHSVLVVRINAIPNPLPLIRVIRNLIEASENEIRVDRMASLIHEVEDFLMSRDLTSLASFNRAQLEDEQRKESFLDEEPDAREALCFLEDNSVLRGSLISFDLDWPEMAERAQAFTRVFDEASTWRGLRGALLATGDYFRRPWRSNFHFGSPSAEGRWRYLLTGSGKMGPEPESRRTWSEFLDEVAITTLPLRELYAQKTTAGIAARVEEGRFDWRYYLLAYPEMRQGESGIFRSENADLDFEICALKRTQLNSYYRDPYLYAIYERSGLAESLLDPWFFGNAEKARWLRVMGSELAVRCRNHGYVILAPGYEPQVKGALDGLPGVVTLGDGHVLWAAPQVPDLDRPVDLVDRIDVGCEVVRTLVAIANEHEEPTGTDGLAP